MDIAFFIALAFIMKKISSSRLRSSCFSCSCAHIAQFAVSRNKYPSFMCFSNRAIICNHPGIPYLSRRCASFSNGLSVKQQRSTMLHLYLYKCNLRFGFLRFPVTNYPFLNSKVLRPTVSIFSKAPWGMSINYTVRLINCKHHFCGVAFHPRKETTFRPSTMPLYSISRSSDVAP